MKRKAKLLTEDLITSQYDDDDYEEEEDIGGPKYYSPKMSEKVPREYLEKGYSLIPFVKKLTNTIDKTYKVQMVDETNELDDETYKQIENAAYGALLKSNVNTNNFIDLVMDELESANIDVDREDVIDVLSGIKDFSKMVKTVKDITPPPDAEDYLEDLEDLKDSEDLEKTPKKEGDFLSDYLSGIPDEEDIPPGFDIGEPYQESKDHDIISKIADDMIDI